MKNLFFILLNFLVIVSVKASGKYQVNLQEPFPVDGGASVSGNNGFDLVTQYVAIIYKYLASVVGLVAVLYIVFSGVQIIWGGISTDMVQKARSRILQAILSLCLLFGSALLLKYINAQFFS